MATTEKITYIYTANTSSMDSNLNKSKGIFSNTQSKAILLGGAIAGTGAAIFKMADKASDLNEAMNVVNQVFGESAKEIIAWSETSIKSMGISQTQALKTAGTYGAMATAQGLSTKEASKMAISLTGLSSDMASFYNVSQDVTASALKGIFTGETEALKQYGIILNDSTLKQYGYNSSMSSTEKIAIRYKAVMDQTKAVQGDFARTSDGLANSTRILKEQFSALITALGQFLIPIVERLVNLLNTGLAVAIALITGDTSNLSAKQLQLYNTITTVVSKFMQFASTVAGIVVPIIKTLIGGFLQIVTTVGGFLMPIITTVIGYFKTLAITIGGLFIQIATQLAPIIAKLGIIFMALWQALLPVIMAIRTLVIAVYGLIQSIVQFLAPILSVLISIFMVIIDIIVTVLGPVITVLANIISAILVVAINILSTVISAVSVVLSFLGNIFQKIAGIVQMLAGVIQLILAVAFGVLQGIATAVGNVFQTLGMLANKLGAFMTNLANSAINGLQTAFTTLLKPVQAIYDLFTNVLTVIKNLITTITDGLIGAINSIPFLPNIGEKMGVGYVGGGGTGTGTNNTNSNTYNYNITAKSTPSLRSLRREQIVFKNHGGLYAN